MELRRGSDVRVAEPAHLTVIVFKAVQNLPLLAALDLGFFRDNGLSLDVCFAPNSMELRDGLAAGRYHIAHTAVDNAVALKRHAGVDIVVLMGGDDAGNELYVQPDIERYEDLRGKLLIVDALDTAFALQAYAMLRQRGLEREAYEVQSVGGTHLRLLTMLEDRGAKAAMLHAPYSILADRAGLKRLEDAVEVLGPYQGTACFTLRRWAEENSDILVRYLQAYIAGVRWVRAQGNRDQAVSLLSDNLGVARDVALASYQRALRPDRGIGPDAALNLEGFANVLAIRAEYEGQDDVGRPEDYSDLSYYDRALAQLT